MPAVAILEDSIAHGSGDSFDESGDVGTVARAVGPSFAYLNLACGNDRADKFVRNHSGRVALAALRHYASSVVIQYGLNDLMNGRMAEQILADRSAIVGSVREGHRPERVDAGRPGCGPLHALIEAVCATLARQANRA